MNERTGKPFSTASARNAAPILEALEIEFRAAGSVLEIGAGTGQHAVCFARAMPAVRWQASDRAANLAGIRAWRDESGLANLAEPVELDVRDADVRAAAWSAVYSANTAHIMDTDAVAAMFRVAAEALAPGGVFCLYGPFRENGRHTSASNADFHEALAAEDPAMGIRDIEVLDELAGSLGLARRSRYAMPANNQLLAWERSA